MCCSEPSRRGQLVDEPGRCTLCEHGHQLDCVQEAGIQSAVREAYNGDSITKQIHKLTRPRTIYEKQVCSLRQRVQRKQRAAACLSCYILPNWEHSLLPLLNSCCRDSTASWVDRTMHAWQNHGWMSVRPCWETKSF